MVQETRVQSQIKSYQKLKKMILGAALPNTQIIRYETRVKLSNPGNGVAPFPQCSSY